jgi:hypothetical protein
VAGDLRASPSGPISEHLIAARLLVPCVAVLGGGVGMIARSEQGEGSAR